MFTVKVGMMRQISTWLLCGSFALAGCSAKHYRRSADREVARIIAARSPAVPNMDPHFTIEATNVSSLERLPVFTNAVEFLGADIAFEQGARLVSLAEALDLAVKFNREYQTRKEQVYLAALALTLAKDQYEPLFGARAAAAYRVDTERFKIVVDEVTNQPRVIPSEDGVPVEKHRVTAQSSFSASWLLRTGTRLTAAATTDFFRYLIGNPPRNVAQSQLTGALLQPLWGGAAYRATMENLTQSERNTLYALRDFTRYRKDFSVQIATAYYGVLQSRDVVQNAWLSYLSFKRSAERTRAFAQEGRVPLSDQGRLEQQELTSESQWANAVRAYKQALDAFKIQLGLPTSAHLALDERELARLAIDHPDIAADDASEIALAMRLDYFNAYDRLEDAARKVPVAVAALKAQVDLVASTSIASGPPDGRVVPVPDPTRYRWDAGLNIDFGLERKAQRNAYRAALIAQKQSERDLSLLGDQIKLQVRDGWRALDQAKRNYESAELGVKLAERRVEEQELRSELGRGVAKDQVDAQVDLTNSKNQRTQALVAHTIARLQFWTALGLLFIHENGQWAEVTDPPAVPVERRPSH
jgi:outer membrane protein TolC